MLSDSVSNNSETVLKGVECKKAKQYKSIIVSCDNTNQWSQIPDVIFRNFGAHTLQMAFGPYYNRAPAASGPKPPNEKEAHELIFSWLSWLAVLLVGALIFYRTSKQGVRWPVSRDQV